MKPEFSVILPQNIFHQTLSGGGGGRREEGGERGIWGLKDIFICENFFQIEDFKSGQPYTEPGSDHFGLDFRYCGPCAAYVVTQKWLQNMWKEPEGKCI